MRVGSLFSGYGGLDLGVLAVLGGSLAWHVEVDPDASRVLAHHWPDVPNLGDITRVDWSQVDPVDVLTGGFPCQDVSSAGKRAGLRPGTRSGLWSQMAYAVSILRPRLVIAENVRGLLSAPAASDVEPCPWCLGDDTDHAVRALGAVLGDLADLGYDTAWCGLRAADVGAPHARYRIFVAAANTDHARRQGRQPARRPDMPARRVAADTESNRRHQGWAEPAGQLRRPDLALGGAPATDAPGQRHRNTRSPGRRRVRSAVVPGDQRADAHAWGIYTAAVQRWERRLGRPAPAPTVDGRRGARLLNPAFVEWIQGVPEGHVTGVPDLSRNAALRMLGNGVVPQQAAAALPWLLDVLDEPLGEVA